MRNFPSGLGIVPTLSKYALAITLVACFCITAHATTIIAGADPEFANLIARCAPTVAPVTMAAIVSTESRGHRFAIADAGPVHMPWAQRKKLVRSFYMGSVDEATAMAESLIKDGHTVSLGLSQVNDRNLPKLGLTVRQMFDPCSNLGAGGRIITEFYSRASKKFGSGTRALNAALSAYNSGDWLRGEREGYVNLIYRQQGRKLAMSSTAAGPIVPSITQGRRKPDEVAVHASSQLEDGGRKFALSANEFVIEK